MNIDIQNEADYPVDETRLCEAVQTVLAGQNADPESAISVVIGDDAHITALNQQFRGIDAPTDVLSFPAEPLPDELRGDEPPYLGDLVIAYPYAMAQAEREGHDTGDSLALLVIHGTLHLLGYDHDTPENRAEMWAAQEKALRQLGISPDIVPALEDAPH